MVASNGAGPLEAAINAFLLIVMLVILYSVYTVSQGGDPSGFIQIFTDMAPGLFILALVIGFTLWIVSEVT